MQSIVLKHSVTDTTNICNANFRMERIGNTKSSTKAESISSFVIRAIETFSDFLSKYDMKQVTTCRERLLNVYTNYNKLHKNIEHNIDKFCIFPTISWHLQVSFLIFSP